jgi:hypothetical protein
MSFIRATAAAQHVQLRHSAFEESMLHAEFNWISAIKLGRFVQLGVTLP